MANIKRANTSGITKSGVAIPDVPDAPVIGAANNVGTSRAYNNGSATVAFTANPRGGTSTSFTATSTPGSFTATGAGSPLTVTGLQSATSYTFAVTGTNASATGPSSGASSSITATTVPATPSAPTATDTPSGRAYDNGAASVAFTAPATGGSAITGYTVTSSPSGLTGTGSSSPVTVTGLASATAYTYTITATNANGTSTASSASASVTATTVPQAPTVGTATSPTSTTASVPFTANATGGSAITSYTVTSSPGSLTGTGASSPITVSGLTTGTAYTFTVTATNANGTSTASSASNSVTPAIVYYLASEKPTASGGALGSFNLSSDANGNTYISTLMYNAGFSQRGAIGKIGSSGAYAWAKMTDQTSMYINASAVASSGNVYLVGTNNGSSPTRVLISKLDSSGSVLWARRLNASAGNSQGLAIAIDSSENVFVVGRSPNAGNTAGISFLAKYNTSGTIQWQRALTNSANTTVLTAVTVDNNGDIIIGGTGGAGSSQSGLLLAKYNTSGTIQWQKSATTSNGGNHRINALACDSSNNLYAAGYLTEQQASYAGEFDSSGTVQWQQAWNSNRPGDGQDRASGVGVDSSGNVYYGGWTGYASDGFGGSIVRGYIAKNNGSGTAQFTNLVTVSSGGGLRGFTFGSDQTMRGATSFNSEFNYVLKAPPDGSKTGTYSAGGNANLVYSSGMTRTNYSNTITWANGTQVDSAGALTEAAETLTLSNADTTTAVTTI